MCLNFLLLFVVAICSRNTHSSYLFCQCSVSNADAKGLESPAERFHGISVCTSDRFSLYWGIIWIPRGI
jgi:hypothetical protein